ncbi:unnamed protein product [Allacma fusca]|uniref:Uncharacterized protein n=1 Tax=Allacma fusca TaxID=39272 RepID=A0A8J2KF48_9HEXA|nr:unnamed protein product [Allacma fusca]
MLDLPLAVKVVAFATTLFVAKVQTMPQLLPPEINAGNSENSFLRPLLIDSYVNCSAFCLIDLDCVGFTIYRVKEITENDPIFWCRTDVEHKNEDLQKGEIVYTAMLRDKLPKVVRTPTRPVSKSKLHARSRRDFSDDEHVFNQNTVSDANSAEELKSISTKLLESPNLAQITVESKIPALIPSSPQLTKVISVPATIIGNGSNVKGNRPTIITNVTTKPGKNNLTVASSKVTAALANPDLAQLTIEHTVPALVESFPQQTIEKIVPNVVRNQSASILVNSIGKPTFTSFTKNKTLSVAPSNISAALENPDVAQLTIEHTVPAIFESFPQETSQVTIPVGSHSQVTLENTNAKPTLHPGTLKPNDTFTNSNITAALENPNLAQLTIEHTVPVLVQGPPQKTNQVFVVNAVGNQSQINNSDNSTPMQTFKLNGTSTTLHPSNATQALENPDLAQLTIEHTVPALVASSPEVTNEISVENAVSNETNGATSSTTSIFPDSLGVNATIAAPLETNTESPEEIQTNIVVSLHEGNISAPINFSLASPVKQESFLSQSQHKNEGVLKLAMKLVRPIAGSNVITDDGSTNTDSSQIGVPLRVTARPVAFTPITTIKPSLANSTNPELEKPTTFPPPSRTPENISINNPGPIMVPSPTNVLELGNNNRTQQATNQSNISSADSSVSSPESTSTQSETPSTSNPSVPSAFQVITIQNPEIKITTNIPTQGVANTTNVIFRTKTHANINIVFETELVVPRSEDIQPNMKITFETANISQKSELPQITNIPPKSEIPETTIIPSISENVETIIIPAKSEVAETTIIPIKSDIQETTIIPPKSEIPETTIIPPKSEIPETTIIPPKSEIPETTVIPPNPEHRETTIIPLKSENAETTMAPPKSDISKIPSIPQKSIILETTVVPLESDISNATNISPKPEIIIFFKNESNPVTVNFFNISNEILFPNTTATTIPQSVDQMITSEIIQNSLVRPPVSLLQEKLPFEDVHIPTTTTGRTNKLPVVSGNLEPVPPQSELLEGKEVATFGSTEIPFPINSVKRTLQMQTAHPTSLRQQPFRIRVTSDGTITIPEDANSFGQTTGSNAFEECVYSDRERVKREITATAFSSLNDEPTLLTFVNNSECVGIFSKTGKKSVRSISKLFPDFPFQQRQVLAGAFYNDSVLLFDDNEEQQIWRFTYDSASQAYVHEPQQFVLTTQYFLKEFCGIHTTHFNIKAVAQFSVADNSCILIDSTNNFRISPHASEDARSLADVIKATVETEFVNYVEAVFAWLDEPDVSQVYIFGSNSEVYEIFKDSFTDFKWKKGSYRVVPYEDFPLR